MLIKKTGETPFSVLANSFMVSPSAEGYTLEFSADGQNYTAWDEPTPANENLVVTNVPQECYYRLKGNKSTVTIKY